MSRDPNAHRRLFSATLKRPSILASGAPCSRPRIAPRTILRASVWSARRLVDVQRSKSILRAQTHRRRRQLRSNIHFAQPISRHHRSHDRFGEGLEVERVFRSFPGAAGAADHLTCRVSLIATTRVAPLSYSITLMQHGSCTIFQ